MEDGAEGLSISPQPRGLNSTDEAEQWDEPGNMLRLKLERSYCVHSYTNVFTTTSDLNSAHIYEMENLVIYFYIFLILT